jgi:hypothetical protein
MRVASSLIVLFFTATVIAATQQNPPAPAPTVRVVMNGDPAPGVSVYVMLNGEKRTGLAPNLPLLAGKFAKGTSIDVHRRLCETGAIDIILLPTTEALLPEDKDCYKAKEPVPGMPCRCNWIGAFNLGDSATIDADIGRVK